MRRAIATAALALAALGGVSATVASPVLAADTELCRFDASVLPEISGLAYSAVHGNVVWAHNDSGGDARLYALDTRTCEVLAELRVRGVDARDPEALAAGVDARGNPVLWWGDIGDNTARRDRVTIYAVPEPETLVDATVRATAYPVRLPSRGDAEALIADGDRLWIIGKGLISGAVWELPHPLPPDRVARARSIGTEDGLVTDAAMRPGGGYAVRDYSEVRIYSGSPIGELIARRPLPEQVQGEAMTWTPDGAALIVASEGDDRLLLVGIDEAAVPDPTPVPSTSIGPTPPASDQAQAIASPAPSVAMPLQRVDRVGSLAVTALAVGAAVFLCSIVIVIAIARIRSRRPR